MHNARESYSTTEQFAGQVRFRGRMARAETFPTSVALITGWIDTAPNGGVMRQFFARAFAIVTSFLFLTAAACSAADRNASPVPAPSVDAALASGKSEQTAVLAGGCFWGIQAVFQHVKGVISATSGYSGGSSATAEYDIVSTGETGHAESVKVTYDIANHLWQDSADILFSCARPHSAQSPRAR